MTEWKAVWNSVFFIAFSSDSFTYAKLTKLVRDATFDGYDCNHNETIFAKTGVTETSCARACHQTNDCLSMFFSPLSRVCIGCTRRLTTDDILGTFDGAQYHAKSKEQISQWVQNVTAFSTQYTNTNWSADQVLGPPDVYPVYDEWKIGQWEPLVLDSNQFLQVQFVEAVHITGVEIYETSNAGMVKAIKVLQGGSWTTAWSTTNVQSITTVRKFTPELSNIASSSKDLRVEFDCTTRIDWVGIDAIKLLGIK